MGWGNANTRTQVIEKFDDLGAVAHLSTSIPTAILTFKLEKQWIFGRGGEYASSESVNKHIQKLNQPIHTIIFTRQFSSVNT